MTDGLAKTAAILATLGVALALLLAALDQTVVGVAMPRIVSDLHGLECYAWVTTAYLITSTALVPVAGKLGDMFGRKPFLLVGMIGFIAASALCVTSFNMASWGAFRALQGVFGGVLFASTFAVLADVFPPEQRARMSGVFGAVFGLSSVIGPTLGGYLTDGPGWRWVFYVNVPLGILAVLLVAAQLPFVKSSARLRDIDWVGTGLLFAGLTPLLIALSMTRDHAWVSAQVLGLLVVAAVSLVAFYFVERRAEHPVVPFHLFRLNVFAVPAAISFFSGVGMFGAVIFVPLLYQGVLGVSATNSGQLLTPMMLGLIVASTLVGQAMVRIRYYRFLGTAGIVVMLVGMWLLSQVTVTTSRLEVVRDIVLVGAGLGTTFPLYLTAVQTALPRNFLGVASSQIQFWRQIGGTICTPGPGPLPAPRPPGHIQEQGARLPLSSPGPSPFFRGGGRHPP